MSEAMTFDGAALGWPPACVGELDHRRLKAPAVKLRSARRGRDGDVVYAVDLRVRLPNADDVLSSAELHSVEHFLLEGFGRLPKVGDSFRKHGWNFEVIDLDNRRIDKVLAKRIGPTHQAVRHAAGGPA